MNYEDISEAIALEIEYRIDGGYSSDEIHVSEDLYELLKNHSKIHSIPIILNKNISKGCFRITEGNKE